MKVDFYTLIKQGNRDRANEMTISPTASNPNPTLSVQSVTSGTTRQAVENDKTEPLPSVGARQVVKSEDIG